MKILWRAAFLPKSGYGKFSREIISILNNMSDIEVDVAHIEPHPFEPIAGINRFCGNGEEAGKIYDFCIDASNPCMAAEFKFPISRHICYSMIETIDVPKAWIPAFKYIKELWVPCEFLVDIFSKYTNVALIQLGYNDNQFYPVPKDKKIDFNLDFVFGNVSTFGGRKNTRRLVSAFYAEFKNEPNVGLFLLTRVPAYYGTEKECWLDIVKSLPENGNKNIFIINTMVPDDKMALFYSSLDAYITPSLGEGWNLPLMEAMACGTPVLATYVTAHLDYITKDNSFRIMSDGTISAKDIKAEVTYEQDAMFNDIKEKSIMEGMRLVYNEKAKREQLAKQALLDIKKFTWESAAKKVVDRLLSI